LVKPLNFCIEHKRLAFKRRVMESLERGGRRDDSRLGLLGGRFLGQFLIYVVVLELVDFICGAGAFCGMMMRGSVCFGKIGLGIGKSVLSRVLLKWVMDWDGWRGEERG
jgi:hypothetical protein